MLLACLLLSLIAAPGLADASSTAEREPRTDSLPSPPLLGVVWTPPEHPGPALRALNKMHEAGVTAVRLRSLPPADTVLGRADALGLRLFVDLPVAYVAAAALDDSLRAARPLLATIQRLARQHPSLYAVGLAQGANTSTPAACGPLRRWTQRVHEGPPPLHTYYVTPFPAESDRCRDAPDWVLLDTRGRPAPARRWAQWRDSTAQVGMGALGTWVAPTADPGLRVPHSPERQARHLERALTTLLDDSTALAAPVFAYRWSDRAPSPLPTRQYGLHTRDGRARPAANVLSGIYQGTQRVFAFPLGTPVSNTPVGALLLGWALLALLGGLYARNPFVRQTLYRYFGAHGFYRDAVREGREVGEVENGVLLSVVGGALGIIGALVADIAGPQPATGLVVEALPIPLQSPVALGLTHPLAAGLAVGGLSILLLGGWALLLTLAARTEGPFSAAQALMLVTWPCWPAVLGMIVALVAATQPPISAGLLGLSLLTGGALTIGAVTVRVLRDYWLVSGVALPWALLLIVPSPLSITLLGLGLLVGIYDLPVSLLWHLATRT